MEEIKHWESLKAGEINALQTLYNYHIGALYSYGMILCQDRDKVNDCLQDLFVSLWNSHERLNIPQSGKAYLMTSLRRRLFDKGSKLQSLTGSLEAVSDRDLLSPGHEDRWIQSEEEQAGQQKLENALSCLSDRQREIIYMKYYQQMEYEEIGKIMDLNYQSARNLVNRALTALRKEMSLIIIGLLYMI